MRSTQRPVALGGLFMAGLLLPALAASQSIKLPDFREDARVVTPCADCGTIRAVRELTSTRPRPATPALTPDIGTPHQEVLVGAVFYHPFSEESQPYVGGVGTPEMRERFAMTSYEITIRMDDGNYRLMERRDGARFRPGDRVRIVQGSIQPL